MSLITPHVTGETFTTEIFMVMGFDHLWNSTRWVLVSQASFKLCMQATQMAWPSGWALLTFKKPTSMPQSLGTIPFHFTQKCKTKDITSSVHVCTHRKAHTHLTFYKANGKQTGRRLGRPSDTSLSISPPEEPNLFHLIIKSDIINPGLESFFFREGLLCKMDMGRHLSYKL